MLKLNEWDSSQDLTSFGIQQESENAPTHAADWNERKNRVDMYIGQLSWLPEDITLNDKSQLIQEYEHG